MELRHLRYFVTVAETLHFGRAAVLLHIAQPALSVQIRDLERMLGGPLLHRANRRVSLTAAGRLFLHEARQTLAQAERAAEVARSALRGELGRLDIGYSGSAAYSGLLRRYVQAFRLRYPRVELHLQEHDPISLLALLAQRVLRVGFLTTLSLEVPETVVTYTLVRWPMCVVLADNHPLAAQASLSAADLVDETFIAYAGARETERGAAAVLNSFLGYAPSAIQHATSMMMVLTLAGTGIGVAMLPASLAGLAPAVGVVFRPFSGRDLQMDCTLASLRDESEPAVLAFLDCVTATRPVDDP
jgi:DNA-binding transcriptional LysR family regulator